MDMNEMKPFFVWGALFQGMAISWAFKRDAIDVGIYCIIVLLIGAWMGYVQYRRENPKP